MSATRPVGIEPECDRATTVNGSIRTAIAAGGWISIDAAQHGHAHLTQNAGQPLSGADSLVPIAQVSGTKSEVTPLASHTRNTRTAMKSARCMAWKELYVFLAARQMFSPACPHINRLQRLPAFRFESGRQGSTPARSLVDNASFRSSTTTGR
jgi:hypothetical protein